jgi:hypothetical protein
MRILLALVLLLTATPASARAMRALNARIIASAPVSVVATIVGSKVKKAKKAKQRGNQRRNQRGNQRIETLHVTARVKHVLHGSKRGATLRFVHFRATSTGRRLNGATYPALKKGRSYLLVFSRKGKKLQLFAPEDRPVDIPPKVLRSAIKQHTQGGIHKVMALLRLRVLFCGKGCGKAIRLLAQAPAAVQRPKKQMVALLLPLARKSKNSNTRLAAYATLGRYGQTALVPEIVGYIAGKVGRSDQRANAVSWLQGFPKAQQIAALKQILARTSDASVKRAAGYKLSYLTR